MYFCSLKTSLYAQMAELVDALVSNTNGLISLPVQSRLWVLETPDYRLIVRGFSFFVQQKNDNNV